MAAKTSQLLLAFLFLSVLVICSLGATVPAVYIFGDSTADVGNNNYLPHTMAKANFPPNGIDFVHGKATGRFSNGFNTADFLAKSMGFTGSPPPFLSLDNVTLPKHAPTGINFASAGSGIYEGTGNIYGQHISMSKQLEYFEAVRTNLLAHMGTTATEELLSKSFFLISTGSNDLFEYFAALGRMNNAQKSAYISTLSFTYKFQLRKIYDLGARKIGVISIPPIGCCPSQRSLSASGVCLEDLNELARMFYEDTKARLGELSCEVNGLKYSLGNSYEMVTNFLDNPLPIGFTELKAACCGAGKFNGESPCSPNSTVCSNRREYLFWDLFHPTQAACKLAAKTLLGGSRKFVTPINFGELAEYGC